MAHLEVKDPEEEQEQEGECLDANKYRVIVSLIEM